MNKLPAPPDTAGNESAVEVLRVWVVGEELQCALQADAFPEVGDWGAVLADVVRHVARARHSLEGTAEEETIRRILDVFGKEMRGVSGEDETNPGQ